MKQNYFFAIAFCIFFNPFNTSLFAQTVLTHGDVAITSFNADGEDEFSFVLLKDIISGTEIYFTQNGWDDDANGGGIAPTWGNTGEGTLKWTSTSSMSCGTEVQVMKPTLNSTLAVSIGSIVKFGTWALKASGDAIIVYQGTGKPLNGTEVTTFLWVFNTGTVFTSNSTLTTTTGIPTGLIDGTTAIYAGTSDNFQYNCVSTLGPSGSLTTALANATNFTGDNLTTYKASGCSFYCVAVNTWTGATDTNWNTAGNWDGGIPTSSSTIMIPNVANKPIISTITAALANNITVADILSIQAGGSLTVSSNLTNNGTFSINSDATSSGSLIVTGTSTGNITYNRYISSNSTTNWHLFSAPVASQDINAFVTTAGNVNISGIKYSIAPYDNNGTLGVSTWKHWTTDGSNPIGAAGNFVAGKGYEILTTSEGTLAFTGTVAVDLVSIAITQGTTNSWNLVGNPFPSSIPANLNADAVNNFLTVNSAALDPSYIALYFWDPIKLGGAGYELENQSTDSRFIAPGQGFFVRSVAGGANINFTTAMRTNQAAVVFQKTATQDSPSIVLSADNNSGKISTTDLKYLGGMTLGLDPGYDAGRFGAATSSFALYSHLVTDNGVDFAIQALPENSYDTTVIPIGLDANAGTQVTFKAAITNLPLGKKVFLEDKLLNLFTELNNTDKTYTLTLDSQSSGIGRFFLHTQDNLSTLAVANVNALKFGVIALPLSNQLKIIGMVDEPASLNIYDTLGRFVFTTKLKTSNNNEVTIPPLAYGIYIVKIKTAKGNLSTKIAWY